MSTWKNRIVGYADVDPATLVANPKNWRLHATHQQAALSGALDELGWIQDVIVNQRTGFILDGHLRVSLAVKHKQPRVPVKYVELTDDEEALALATFDPIGSLADADAVQFSKLAGEIATEHEALASLITDLVAAQEHTIPGAVPTLDALAEEYSEPDETAFWPTLTVRLSPPVYARYRDVIDSFPGATESARFGALLEAVAPDDEDGP